MKKKTKRSRHRKRKRLGCIYLIYWIIIPLAISSILVLDGLGIYLFNTERLLVIGGCVLVALLPFFNEITVKNVSIKKDDTQK